MDRVQDDSLDWVFWMKFCSMIVILFFLWKPLGWFLVFCISQVNLKIPRLLRRSLLPLRREVDARQLVFIPRYTFIDPRPLSWPGTPRLLRSLPWSNLFPRLLMSLSIPLPLNQLWRGLRTATPWFSLLLWIPTNLKLRKASTSSMILRPRRSTPSSGNIILSSFVCQI